MILPFIIDKVINKEKIKKKLINNNEINEFNDINEINENNIIQSLLKTNITLIGNKSIKTKYNFIKKTLDNIFLDNNLKKLFLVYIQKIQKIFFSLNRFIYIYRFKKSTIVVKEDLYLNPIEPDAKNSIFIFQDNSRYLFILSDLINIINNSLSNSPHFFSEPLSCKNPYNNNPFKKSSLYNIYFYIKKYNHLVPTLFHLFFLCNFNLLLFKERNEYFIREYVINDYIKTKNVNILYTDIMLMLNNFSYMGLSRGIKIDPSFPKKELVFIMKPYLLLYLHSKFSLSSENQFQACYKLKKKLYRFYKYNPLFGRKKIDLMEIYCPEKKKIIIKKIIYFNNKYISFVEKEIDFMFSHYYEEETSNLNSNNNNNNSNSNNSNNNELGNLSSNDTSVANEEQENNIYISSESDNEDLVILNRNLNNRNENEISPNIISYHTDVDEEFFNQIYESMYNDLQNDGLEEYLNDNTFDETKEDDSIS